MKKAVRRTAENAVNANVVVGNSLVLTQRLKFLRGMVLKSSGYWGEVAIR